MKPKDKIALFGVMSAMISPTMPRNYEVVEKPEKRKTKVMPKGVKPYMFDTEGNLLSVGVLPEANDTEKVCVYAINETNARRKLKTPNSGELKIHF